MSLISKANRLGGFSTDAKHWEYEWTATAKQNENGTDDKVKYKFKEWVKQDSTVVDMEEDDSDVLNLDEFDRTKIAKKHVRAQENGGPESLSINDIRGAVGGSDIPGFSSSDAKKEAEAKHESKPEPKEEPKEEPEQEQEPAQEPEQEPEQKHEPEQEQEAEQEPAKDEEGDVNME